MASKSIFLDIDPSLCERNYLIANDKQDDEIGRLFPVPASYTDLPPKVVKPAPGFCIKSRNALTDAKVFINICKTDAIPAPKDITEAELIEILGTDDIVDFRVPMSIGDLRTEKDKSGNDSFACDIAINTIFFEKIQKNVTFKEFLIAVACEGFKEKHGVELSNERIQLQNRKAMGTLQMHRIQQREIDQKMGRPETLPSVDEILGVDATAKNKIIEVISDRVINAPQYRLFKKINQQQLFAEVYLPKLQSSKDLTLDIGEDRLILESIKNQYFLDIFHQFLIDQTNTNCYFNKDTKVSNATHLNFGLFLTVSMPIKNC